MRDVVKRTKLTENCSKKTIKKYVDEVIQELTLDEKIGDNVRPGYREEITG